jgi:ATP-dependent DNA helicase PIF1
MILSEEQEDALNKFKRGENLFITGPGGTGKTFLIKELINNTTKKVQVCALTGCAAILLQCNARTIHSWSGIKLAKGEIEDIVNSISNNKYQRKTWRTTHVLIIDEVSMMSKKIFDLLNIVAKTCRNNIKPFGNMQVVFLGDFYQLPPVSKSDDEDNNKFCFESDSWFDVFPKQNHILLTKIFRQDDIEYKDILMNIREGIFDEKTKEILEKRKIKFDKDDKEQDNIIKIFPLKMKVDTVNIKNFLKLEGEEYTSDIVIKTDVTEHIDTGKVISEKDIDAYKRASPKQVEFEINYIRGNSPSVSELKLKVGARVMCIINLDMENEICNGSQGIVEEIIKDSENKMRLIIVKFDNGIRREICKHGWQSEVYPNIVMYQFPLILAWAITIHKIQGATLDKAIMDIGDSIFEYGQTYVALSRIKKLEGLYLTALNINKIKVNPKVYEFYKNIEKKETVLNIENYKYIEDNEKNEISKDIKIVKL